ncbi:MAG: amidohydrolase family protein [Verrucomicrobia bacterium]|nr:amidohydrolase family protein [Verrucomicrobiota bacterium]
MHSVQSAGQDGFSRRHFLKASSAGVAGSALAGCATWMEKFSKPGYVDAHVHVWTPDTKSYPLAEDFTVKNMVPPSFTPEELLAQARPLGVSRVVLIQMSFYRFDNSYMLDSMRRYPGVFSGAGIVDENAPLLRDRIRDLAQQGVRGFRINPGKQTVDEWLGSPGTAMMWATCADENLAVCPLINPGALPAIGEMCAKFPRTRVVIDHFARIGVTGEIKDSELDALCALAKFPAVHVKTSAFYALGRKAMPYLDLIPMIRRLRDAFGAERLMWATDCPYQVQQGHTYAASLSLVRDRLDFLSADEREWMLRKTAEKVFFNGTSPHPQQAPKRHGIEPAS